MDAYPDWGATSARPSYELTMQRVILPAPPGQIRFLSGYDRLAQRHDQIELDRIALDPDLKSKIEIEFLKEKRYKLVDSAAKADFVFLVEGYYIAMASREVPGHSAIPPDSSWRVMGMGARSSPISGGSIPIIGDPEIPPDSDANPDLLKAALAIALPATEFQHHFGDGEALVRAKLWEGSVISRILPPVHSHGLMQVARFLAPAKPESLVKQFHNKEKMPANYPPVCGATAGIIQLPVGVGFEANAEAKPILMENSGPITPASSAQGQKAAANDNTIKGDVSQVTVPVFVGNTDGTYVPALRPSDFHVFEDGVEQKIDRLIPGGDPQNVVLMMDTSNSMVPAFGEVENVASPFVGALRPKDRVMLVSFDDRIFVRSELTSDHDKLRGAIAGVPSFPATRLYDAIDLVKRDRLDGIPDRKAMIVITNGIDTRSRLADSASTLKEIEEGNVLTYVIQCDTKSEARAGASASASVYPKSKTGWIPLVHPDDFSNQSERYAGGDSYLYNLSKGSGGDLYFASTFDDLKDILVHIAEELGHEYTICYHSSNTPGNASYHHLHVAVDVSGVRVRSRPGYRPR